MDTQGIIEKLVAIEGAPLKDIAKKQAAASVKISSLGTLMSLMDAVGQQAKFLGTTGLSTIVPAGTYSDFNISGAPANAGRYTVNVESLARAAKTRSTTVYNSADDVVTATAKDLKLSVDGTTHTISVAANTTLSQLVTQINGANKPFTASLVSDGTQYYVTLTNKNTGFVVGQPASSALAVVNELGVDMDLGLGLSSPPNLQATNAVATVDGLRVERRTNEMADVIPGATLSLKAASQTNLDVVFNADAGSSTSMLQALLDKYNKLVTFIKAQSDIDPAAAKNGDKLGGGIVKGIQRKLETMMSNEVNTTGTIRTLRDLGVKLQKDGSLKLDSAVLSAALAKDPTAVNAIFGKATTGLGDSINTYIKTQTDGATGILISRRDGIDRTTKLLTKQAERLEDHLEAFRRKLNIQFQALENVMTGVNSTAKFLDAQDAQLRRKT
jgi:flagellar hook-associated protein 2